MNLSSQDSLRLNVLLRQPLKAVRIDESRMVVHALMAQGETLVELNPVGRHEHYLRTVRQLFSTHVLGSPGGYPVFLKRWTRMGQARDESLAKLLLLGEPEAVTAVVHANGLTEEIASHAWWAAPTAENARRMLERDSVAQSAIGRTLTEFLLEFLPFEEEHRAMIDSVRLVLKPGLLSTEERQQLWSKARRKPSYYVGFLHALPDNLPEQAHPHPTLAEHETLLNSLTALGNPIIGLLLRCLSATGQGFLRTLRVVFEKPANQDVVVMALEASAGYFADARNGDCHHRGIVDIEAAVSGDGDSLWLETQQLIQPLGEAWFMRLRALRCLALCGVPLVDPVFGLTDAMGTVMRRKLEPVLDPMLAWVAALEN